MRAGKSGISPYVKYGKKPYNYSMMYLRVMRKEDTPLAKHLRSRKYGYTETT